MLFGIIYASIAGLLTLVMIYILFVIDRMKNAKNDGKWSKRTMPEFLARCNPILEERIAFGKETRIEGTRGSESKPADGATTAKSTASAASTAVAKSGEDSSKAVAAATADADKAGSGQDAGVADTFMGGVV